MMNEMPMEKPMSMKEDKSKKIDSIHISPAENGFIYRVSGHSGEKSQMMGMSKEYVYDSIEDVLAAVKDDLGSPHMKYPSKERMAMAFHEMKENEPGIVGQTRKKKGKEAAKRQLKAIAIAKARGGLFKK